MTIDSPPIGFEGFEKRLEITFKESTVFSELTGFGLRALTRSQLDSILEPACCTIVSQLSNAEFDSYILSESSLFIYPLKIVIKTCGTTKLLLSIKPILSLADSLSLGVTHVRYSRGTFIFPDHQPAPHRTFSEEVATLNDFFGHLNPLAHVLGDWHIYSASRPWMSDDATDVIAVEICMTGLDKKKAAVFFKNSGYKPSEMTKISRISEIMPSHVICDFGFDPCGYSMNGIDDDGSGFSTVHVTPEDGFSYASYEVMDFAYNEIALDPLINRVLRCFEPKRFSVAVTCRPSGSSRGGLEWWAMECDDVDGYTCKCMVKQELHNGGCIVYRSYEMKDDRMRSNPLMMKMHCREEVEEEKDEVMIGGGGSGGDGGPGGGGGIITCPHVSCT